MHLSPLNHKSPQRRGMSAMLRRLAARNAARTCLAAFSLAGLLAAGNAQAGTFTKDNNTTALNTATSYTAATTTVPGSGDVILFNNTITSPLSFGSGSANPTFGDFQIVDPGGPLTLTINNTSGSTAGTMTVGMPTGGDTVIDMSAATQDFTITGGTLRFGAVTTTRTFNVAAGRTLTINSFITTAGNTQTLALNGAGSIVLNGSISNGKSNAPFGLSIGGANVALNAANTYGNGTTLSSGTLSLGNVNALQFSTLTDNSAAANAVTFASGIGTFNISGLVGTGSFALTDAATNAVTLSVGSSNAATTYSGILTGSGGIAKVGTGTLTLSGASTNTGGLTVNAGQVTLGNNTGAGTGTITLSGGNLALSNSIAIGNAVAVNGTGTLFAGSAGQVNGTLSSTAGSTLNIGISSPNLLTLAGSMTGFNGTLSLGASTGTLRLNNSTNINFGSATTLFDLGTATASLNNRNGSNAAFNLGGLQGGSGTFLSGSSGSGTTANSNYSIGALNTSTTFAGTVVNGGGTTTITKVGTGTLTFTGNNTYTGGTVVNGGTLSLGATAADGTGTLTVNSGGTVTITTNNALGGGNVTLAGGTLQNAVAATGTTPATNQQTSAILSLASGTASTLDFGAANLGATFTFTGFDAAGTGALSIINYLGTPVVGNGLDQLFIAGTPLTASQLGQISFVTGGVTFAATQLASGEIVENAPAAAPEPSQWAAFGVGLLGLGMLTLKAGKRRLAA